MDVSERHARFVTLDALRGIAAIVVAFFHTQIIGEGLWRPRFGYLSVDLFFLLSGFVISYAYDRRLGADMDTLRFLYLRIARLYPLYLFGLALGASVAIINFDLGSVTARGIAINFGWNFLGLPVPMIEGFQAENYQLLFPLNVPFWSLFFEFWVANVVYAFTRDTLRGKALLFTIAACAVGVLISEKMYYTMSVGQAWDLILGGFPRVGFSFFSGVALSRLWRSRRHSWKVPVWPVLIAIPLLLSVPLEGRAAHLYELICVLMIFPLLIYFGASVVEGDPRVGELLGDASYALYTIHAPLLAGLRWLIAKMAIHPSLLLQVCAVVALLPMGWAMGRVDIAARRWLLRAAKR